MSDVQSIDDFVASFPRGINLDHAVCAICQRYYRQERELHAECSNRPGSCNYNLGMIALINHVAHVRMEAAKSLQPSLFGGGA